MHHRGKRRSSSVGRKTSTDTPCAGGMSVGVEVKHKTPAYHIETDRDKKHDNTRNAHLVVSFLCCLL